MDRRHSGRVSAALRMGSRILSAAGGGLLFSEIRAGLDQRAVAAGMANERRGGGDSPGGPLLRHSPVVDQALHEFHALIR